MSLAAAQMLEAARYQWADRHARPSQREPGGDWRIWLILTGRGWGKTRTAAETVRGWVESGKYDRIHLVARTAADARATMIEGKRSGILAISPPWFRPKYEPSKRRLTWPNGAEAEVFYAEEPDKLRGPECDAWWADELCTWKYQQDTWDNLQLGARTGSKVKGVITTTPRPQKLLKELVARSDVTVTLGHMRENEANLAPDFIAAMEERYGGTRKGRQELNGEILDDNPNALWSRAQIEKTRVTKAPEFKRVVVAIDPSITPGGDECGIGAAAKGVDDRYYILSDDTVQAGPATWARTAVTAFHRWNADRLIYESNQGGDMVALTLGTVEKGLPLRSVHASRGKKARAEPIAALYEQGRVSHVGTFPDLEDEMCEWEPDTSTESPNRVDWLVWALWELHKRKDQQQSWSY